MTADDVSREARQSLTARVARLSHALERWIDGTFDVDLIPALVGELRLVSRLLEDAHGPTFTEQVQQAVEG